MKKWLLIAGLILLAGGLSYYFWPKSSQTTETTDSSQPEASSEEPPELEVRTFRLLATGDMIPHETINVRANNTQAGYLAMLDELNPAFESADFVFCNQEAPSAGSNLGIAGYPSFNAPVDFAKALSARGCNLINLANNHVGDRGTPGIDATLDVWGKLKPLAISGANRTAAEQDSVSVFEIGGQKVAFVSFAEFSNNRNLPGYALNLFSDSLVNKLMSAARKQADFIIVSAHWGVEDQQALSSFQTAWAKKLAAAGADLIIGTGPHVAQTVDEIKQPGGDTTLVYYSLGNALTTQLTLEELTGLFAVVDIELKGNELSIIEAGVLPVYMHYEWTSQQAANEDLLERNNLELVALDQATDYLNLSLFTVSPASQINRLKALVNQNVDTKVYSLDNL